MLQLYYARPSAYARPVWLALLEKQLPFELIPVHLGGEQLEPEFLAINPFGHVPVLVDGDVRIIESLAILDYLEAQYPSPPLLPHDAVTLARVRMVQLVTLNELLPAIFKLLVESGTSDAKQSEEWIYAQRRAQNTLGFFENLLGDALYFAGDQLTMAEIVAGTLVGSLPGLGVAFTDYPRLRDWSARLWTRPSWQQIALSPEEWHSFKRHVRVLPKIWQRRRRQRMNVFSQS